MTDDTQSHTYEHINKLEHECVARQLVTCLGNTLVFIIFFISAITAVIIITAAAIIIIIIITEVSGHASNTANSVSIFSTYVYTHTLNNHINYHRVHFNKLLFFLLHFTKRQLFCLMFFYSSYT